ncbi:MAG: hypothetical protein V1659_00430, partial [Candidatus Woesearchaeota archaeon]
ERFQKLKTFDTLGDIQYCVLKSPEWNSSTLCDIPEEYHDCIGKGASQPLSGLTELGDVQYCVLKSPEWNSSTLCDIPEEYHDCIGKGTSYIPTSPLLKYIALIRNL